MKKIIVFLIALCISATSSFAAVSITDWNINCSDEYVRNDSIIEDVVPTGFLVKPYSDVSNEYYSAFCSTNLVDLVYYDNNSFKVEITGFENTYVDEPGDLDVLMICFAHRRDNADDRYKIGEQRYLKAYTGPGIYNVESDDLKWSHSGNLVDGDPYNIVWVSLGKLGSDFGVTTITYGNISENDTGSIRFITSEESVPEPSSLLALAFGGAGTAFAFLKGKQR